MSLECGHTPTTSMHRVILFRYKKKKKKKVSFFPSYRCMRICFVVCISLHMYLIAWFKEFHTRFQWNTIFYQKRSDDNIADVVLPLCSLRSLECSLIGIKIGMCNNNNWVRCTHYTLTTHFSLLNDGTETNVVQYLI